MRFTQGWIKAHRSIARSELADNVFLFSLWMYFLLIANYKESKIIWSGKQRILKPGQFLFKVRELSERWSCSPATIHKWTKYLSESERIVIESRTHGTIITICNWEEYQVFMEEVRTPSEHQVNTARTPSEHQVNYSKEEVPSKKKRREEGKKNTGIRTEYPEEFQTLWVKYGKVGDKKAAFDVWKDLGLSEIEIASLSRSIESYVKNRPDPKFRKYFCRFLKTDWREPEPTLQNGNAGNGWLQGAIEEDQIHQENGSEVSHG